VIRAWALLVVLSLAAILFMQWRDWPHPPVSDSASLGKPTNAPTTDPASDATALLPGPPEPKETYAAVSDRTLFRPQRKPEPPQVDEPAPEDTAAVDASLDGIDLTAVLIAPGLASAWIKEPSGEQLKRLRLGDDQAGWVVKSILPDRVVFERGGTTNEMILQDFSQRLPPPPAPPPPARPSPAARPGQPPGPNQKTMRPNQPPAAATPQRPPNTATGPRGAPPTLQQKQNARRSIPQPPK
jgi:general secretion pathway protein N